MIKTKNYNEQLYQYDQATIKRYGQKYKLTYHKGGLRQKGFEMENYKRQGVNEHKLEDNVSRARAKIFEYGICNDWQYFVTLTLDPKKYDRKNLKGYHKDLSQWIRDTNKRLKTKIRYLLIPEQHKDNSWHMHGFIAGLPDTEITKNEHGYWDWGRYKDKFGWISIDKIKDKERCSRYITKYVNKDLNDRKTELNAHLYYCSRGLKTSDEIKRGTISRNGIIPTDYENDHVKIKWSTNLNDLAVLFD